MPSELEELVGFIAHPNPQIRALATQNLIPYSTTDPTIFKAEQLKPIKHLKFLINDQRTIAGNALNILVNLSGDPEVLQIVASDEKFLDRVFAYIVDPEEPNANMLCMLLANLAKSDITAQAVLAKTQPAPEKLASDPLVLNQLMDLFVKGQDGAYNKAAGFDYLAYVFADLAKHAPLRQFFLRAQPYDGVVPLTKLKVFTEHASEVRRKGVASTIKNAAFEVPAHPALLADDEINILPYILLPIMGNEEYDMEESMDMLPDLQLLPPDKKRDPDNSIVQTHVETLMLLTATRAARDHLRAVKVYPVIRETHMRVDDEGVKEACERLVQVLARDEAPEERVVEIDEEDELVEV
ncbi:FAM203 family protein [Escovopsis weberi]|uniref:Protein HGH1 homolog n=1 Tax=Escovopsis weberi TaxID=150374 RepID=A0A0M8N8E4_ESCWE|nr:FAM203 family protein [Escovopsis weberi]